MATGAGLAAEGEGVEEGEGVVAEEGSAAAAAVVAVTEEAGDNEGGAVGHRQSAGLRARQVAARDQRPEHGPGGAPVPVAARGQVAGLVLEARAPAL